MCISALSHLHPEVSVWASSRWSWWIKLIYIFTSLLIWTYGQLLKCQLKRSVEAVCESWPPGGVENPGPRLFLDFGELFGACPVRLGSGRQAARREVKCQRLSGAKCVTRCGSSLKGKSTLRRNLLDRFFFKSQSRNETRDLAWGVFLWGRLCRINCGGGRDFARLNVQHKKLANA